MTATIPPTLHEEIAALDAIELALVKLTTADLEAVRERVAIPPALPCTGPLATVMPANAGTHAAHDAPTERDGAATPGSDGSAPARG